MQVELLSEFSCGAGSSQVLFVSKHQNDSILEIWICEIMQCQMFRKNNALCSLTVSVIISEIILTLSIIVDT